jgi:hypothetical protein
METPSNRRVKSGSQEDLSETPDIVYLPGKKFNLEGDRRGHHGKKSSIGDFNKDVLGISGLDLGELPPSHEELQREREEGALGRELDDLRGREMSEEYEDEDEDVHVGGRGDKDRGDSISVTKSFLIEKLDMNDLGEPAGEYLTSWAITKSYNFFCFIFFCADPVPAFETKFTKRIKSGSNEDFDGRKCQSQ